MDAYLYLENEDRKIDSLFVHRVSDGFDEPNNLGVGRHEYDANGVLRFIERPAYCSLARRVGAEPELWDPEVCSGP